MRWLSSPCAVGFDERNQRRSGGILGEGGPVWEMAATSLHNDVLLSPEECPERASHCIGAYDYSLVGSFAGARGCGMASNNIVLGGMPRMGAMEQLSALCGRLRRRWKDSMTMQEREIKQREPWSWTWRKLSSR